MGKSRINNAKVLKNYLVGLSTENKKKANDIINLYKDNIVGNYKTAENMILKLSSRGKGQEKVNEKLTKLKKVNIISSIVRRGVKDPKSSTFIYLNTDVRVFTEIFQNKGSKTHQDIYDTVLEEIKKMLKNKIYEIKCCYQF